MRKIERFSLYELDLEAKKIIRILPEIKWGRLAMYEGKKKDTITQGANLVTDFVYRYVIMMLVTIMGIQTVTSLYKRTLT